MAEQRDMSLLIADDDEALRTQLGRAMTSRGFDVCLAGSVAEAIRRVNETPPAFAIVDLRLEDGDGLQIIDALHIARDDVRVIMLSGYGNIPTAVAAVKAGAIDYLPKPADADEIEQALLTPDGSTPPPPNNPPSPDIVRLTHIAQVFQQHDKNISQTARALGMHRRTLQRILAKHKLDDLGLMTDA